MVGARHTMNMHRKKEPKRKSLLVLHISKMVLFSPLVLSLEPRTEFHLLNAYRSNNEMIILRGLLISLYFCDFEEKWKSSTFFFFSRSTRAALTDCMVMRALLVVIGACIGAFSRTATATAEYDVLVYGSTPSGIVAAVAAARHGANTVSLVNSSRGGL